jgi:FkbM family methyltransferase
LLTTKTITALWIKFVSFVIWALERGFFYPKLNAYYRRGRESRIIFDVGANKGQSITFFTKLFPSAEIHAFEPSALIFEKLVGKKFSSKIHLNNVGLSEKEGTFEFYECALDETSTFDKPNFQSKYLKTKSKFLLLKQSDLFVKTTAKVLTLDTYMQINQLTYIDILKIDVEGHELKVLKGAEIALRSKKIRSIQFESHLDDMRDETLTAIVFMLKSFDFKEVKRIKHPFGNFHELIFIQQ